MAASGDGVALTVGACGAVLCALGLLAHRASGPVHVPRDGSISVTLADTEPEVGDVVLVTVCAQGADGSVLGSRGRPVRVGLTSATGARMVVCSASSETPCVDQRTQEQRNPGEGFAPDPRETALNEHGRTALDVELAGEPCRTVLLSQEKEGTGLLVAQSGTKQVAVAMTLQPDSEKTKAPTANVDSDGSHN